MDEILQKAKELGMLIANSQEFALVKATEEAQLADDTQKVSDLRAYLYACKMGERIS